MQRRTFSRQTIVLTALALALAAASGCGGGTSSSGAASSSTAGDAEATQTKTHDCLKPAVRQRELARLAVDTTTIKRLADKIQKPQDPGPVRLQRATDRFLTHLGESHLDYMVQNRLTDHAAAAVAFACHACFEMLENDRPVPAMQYGGSGHCPA